MQRLFLFLYQYRAFFLFVFLEVFSVWLIVNNNQYQGASFFNSSNAIAANILESKNDISSYFGLTEVNETLSEENARLRKEIAYINLISSDTSKDLVLEKIDQFDFQSAKVINNSTRRFNNFITINKGSVDGIEPDMAVINAQGIVGKVRATSKNFATIVSLLHPDLYVSSLIKGSGVLCTTKWNGKDPQQAELMYVPRHVKVEIGDTVVTSGYNAIFPPNLMIGRISSVDIKDDATFYSVLIDLSTDFESLSYVYVVNNKFKQEIDSLEQMNIIINE